LAVDAIVMVSDACESVSMSSDALEVARRSVRFWNSGDLEAIYEDWDQDVIVVPDPYFPDSAELKGQEAGRRFWDSWTLSMGKGLVEILEEHDLDDRCMMRVRHHVRSPSGVEGAYEWSLITSVRNGKVTRLEFYIDRERGLEAAGLGR
jgi:ketosteroid isomerase-like protein